ncbi:hypothetical protein HETIRDRAFT_58532 [Heterobasidion irregulare TC 32-1]|uniref:FAD/NAD(P)-binding domain-containing protein n=1 Tax=Heterobasidion irregulare (strain TC 32-1) TaxID=747525 RepID=W4KM41_HETIT|nr:uncharacterized protein HETIRDRAFT_58532 [Heterobasidion irregulare TC 32-1]ETW86440.1 hypothetical protein HETIRDRAFT_58532 [Heterobasidion irregulare TC 32-1]
MGAKIAKEAFQTGDFAIDEYRPMKVVCIGAGFSGIIAGIRFAQRVPNLDLKIYDKEAGVGGTWFVNKYPGLACDIPSHCYQLSFEENTQWSSFYAPGPEILAYLQRVVEKYKLTKYIRLQHELTYARWDEGSGKWSLRIRRPRFPHDFEDTADVLFLGTGSLSRWSWPEIEGLKDFKGRLMHSAQWDVSEGNSWEESVKDWGNKTVGVIGIGSSAIQIVPALQPKVAKVVNLVRGKTWISSSFSETKMTELLALQPGVGNYVFSDAEKGAFKDPKYYKPFRHELESDLNSVHGVSQRGSEMQKAAAAAFKAAMVMKLAKKPEIAEYIVPSFDVSCRRLTPGPGYLESLCEDNVDFETTPIKRIFPSGIEFVDGRRTDLDVLVCATGFDTSYRMPFEVIGREGRDLRKRWEPHAVSYLSVAVDGFPNMFLSLGPNSAVNSGSLLILMEREVDYAVAATLKLQRERLKSIEVKAEAVADYDEYTKACWITLTVYVDQCHSWYKNPDGTITGLWPGSCLHAVRALASPRWEDFNYESLPGDRTRNRFYWLGDGYTHNEKTMTGDPWYLNDDQVDIPTVVSR